LTASYDVVALTEGEFSADLPQKLMFGGPPRVDECDATYWRSSGV
jgi:hypothetical protein